MILLDMVGDRELTIPREGRSDPALWKRLRNASRRVGVGAVFPAKTQGRILDDHYPFVKTGVPAIALIDFTYPCWHTTCDDLSAVSIRSIDAVGETVLELLGAL
jgi:Zn-dependent M28 family amino/carboxypeptidase